MWVLKLGLLFLFSLGLKVLQCKGFIQFLFHLAVKSSNLRSGFCVENGFHVEISSIKYGLLKFLKSSDAQGIEKLGKTRENEEIDNSDTGSEVSDEEEDEDDEDEEFDALVLRKLVKIERCELEKERMAAASAAEEAMAMILRLQREKSLVEMEANHYRRLAEEKKIYDQEVIQSLEWIIMKHELEKSVMEDQLRFCVQKLRIHVKGDEEVDQYLSDNEEVKDNWLISSLDLGSSPK